MGSKPFSRDSKQRRIFPPNPDTRIIEKSCSVCRCSFEVCLGRSVDTLCGSIDCVEKHRERNRAAKQSK